jgi:hypothetical protein
MPVLFGHKAACASGRHAPRPCRWVQSPVRQAEFKYMDKRFVDARDGTSAPASVAAPSGGYRGRPRLLKAHFQGQESGVFAARRA